MTHPTIAAKLAEVAEHAHRANALTMEFLALWATERHGRHANPVLPLLNRNFVGALVPFVMAGNASKERTFACYSEELQEVRARFLATQPDMPNFYRASWGTAHLHRTQQ
jgi:hypothetical protein